MLVVVWIVVTILAIFDVTLMPFGQTISEASRHEPVLRFAVAMCFIVGLALWLVHSNPGSRI